MCGIGGFSGDFGVELLDRFVACLRHRGPDDRGTFFDPEARVGLAHTRLSILDLSPRGHQHMRDPESGCLITYNGELYNFRALRSELAESGHRFTSDSDTEVLLRLYAVHGTDMLPLLDGIFAFAIWDPRDGSLFLARDQLGVKPLYFATPKQGVLFASEIKALLASPAVSRELDVHAIDATLRHLWCPGPRTVLSGVHKLEPGCALSVREGRVAREWRYFHFPVQEPWAGRPPDGRDPVRAMQAELERAVSDQMVSDVPIGAFLSGGIDSSTVVAFASRHAEKIPCFTMRFTSGRTAAEGFDDDLPYAREVAAHLGVELVEVPVGAEVAGELEAMIHQLDEPQADVAPLNVRRIAEAARARGIKVLLSGAGGDDLFAGYRRHQAATLERFWAWLPAPARRAMRDVSAGLPQDRAAARRIAKAFRHADLDRDERLAGYFEWIGGEERRRLFQPDVAAELAAGPAYQPLLDAVRRLPRKVHPINRVLYLDGRYFLPDHNLNYTDKMAMAVGVEVRVPLLAVGLARFGASLPIRYKLRGRTGKWILREAVRELLPASVLSRSKTGFGVPLRTWLHGDLAPLLGDVLSAESLTRGGLFDPAGVQALVEADRAGKVDAAYPILAVVCVELWRHAFLEGDRAIFAPGACAAEQAAGARAS
jgi:asparagine synthase (glutamine-hydrolysing)